ncbi:hypothetical protein JCM19047_2793 [Bacillus sp. JCM 19047]|uniref:DUF3784 domain-containing protein n=1 Tax=Shouchella miscanthi TaxID=2598861 RepID=UPI0003EFF592|nr:DUF3784 domain-containing protein [Shouchella miscanthi]GAF23005.1 hypothetical protein JCM19047_2793 [Bacillus sp. JCM 19047]
MIVVYGTIIGVIGILMIVFSLVILKTKKYQYLSGFATRSKEEQEQLIKKDLPRKQATLMLWTSVLLLLLLIPVLFSVPGALPFQLLVYLISLLGGLTYLSRYELEGKRKRAYIVNGGIATITVGIVGSVFFLGAQAHDFVIHEDSIEITGPYGSKWPIAELDNVEKIEERPSMTRLNGIGTPDVSKGHFRRQYDRERVLVFRKGTESDYLHLQFQDQEIYVNAPSNEQLDEWYEALNSRR